MYSIIKADTWQPIDNVQLEENALDSIREKNNVLVIAGPGAGKTELLAQKACYLLQTNKCRAPQKILAISFKKDAAVNLQERVEKRCGKELSSRFISITYDAFAKSIVDRFRKGLIEEYIPNADYNIAMKDDLNIERAFMEFNHFFSDKSRNDILGNINLPLTGNYIYEKVWSLLIKGDGNLIKPTLNFQMISRLAEYILRTNSYILKALRFTYSHVFLDEFQDTTSIQYELLKTCFKDSDTNLTAVGDAKQRIMGWAGALQTIFADYKDDFYGVEKQLFMNHRSAPKLVELQKLMYQSLNDNSKEIKCSQKWNENDGEVYLYKFSDYKVEAKTIALDIKNRKENGMNLSDMCILTKQLPERYTKKIIEELSNFEIKARIENQFQDLLKEPIITLLIHSLYLIVQKKCPDSFEYVNDVIVHRKIQGSLQGNHETFDKLQQSLSNLFKELNHDLQQCNDISTFKSIIARITDFYDVKMIKAVYPQYNQGIHFNKLLDNFIKLLWNEYMKTTSNWKIALENFQGLNSIPIMTIHKSKGLEYDMVYFIGLEDNAFWNFKNQPAEDRCAFFVALSRAKKGLAFTFSSVRSGNFPCQNREKINEFFELLESVDYVEKIEVDS